MRLRIGKGLAAALVMAVLASAACASKSSSAGSPKSVAGVEVTNLNNSGVPKRGGVLTVLGTSNVDDNLDPNYGYYPLDYVAYQLYERQLYTYPSIPGQTYNPSPDLATAMPLITDGGYKESVTIRSGAMWDTTPPRQVTAADIVRGVKRSCNPTFPWAGQANIDDILVGYQAYCQAFSKVSTTSEPAQVQFMSTHDIAGVTVDPSNPLTVEFTLSKPVNYFADTLTLSWANPVPVEYLQYLPNTPQQAEHTYSDGPYKVKSYVPNRSIVFVRNQAWNPQSDPIRHGYVDQIKVSETGNIDNIYQQILANNPSADMEWDVHVPTSAISELVATKNPDLEVQPAAETSPYIVFNTVSKNDGGALSNMAVRQAISYAIDRAQLIDNEGGPDVATALTHILAPGTDGSAPNFDDYPYNPVKARQLLQQAGYSHLNLTMLYQPWTSTTDERNFGTLQADLAAVGITLKGLAVSGSDFYSLYLDPGLAAKQNLWDLAEVAWTPQWYPNGAKSYLPPILEGGSLPPGGDDYGFFQDHDLDGIINQALAATSEAQSSLLWHQADQEAMAQAAVYPIADPNVGTVYGAQVHNRVFIGPIQNCDLANIWLS